MTIITRIQKYIRSLFKLHQIQVILSILFKITNTISSLSVNENNHQPIEKNRWEFLDGYRGSLAIIVLISHSKLHTNCEIINLAHGYSQSYSIAGFFMLSAFLLTYRLLKDLSKASTLLRILFHIIKYAIRRFLRIYVYYILFYSVVKYGPRWIGGLGQGGPSFNYNQSIYDIATLGNAGVNHLWTIPAEIKYYFFIPLFCLIARLHTKIPLILLIICLMWSILDMNFNFFDLSATDSSFNQPKVHHLKTHFSVFILGSQVALAFFLIEQNVFLMSLVKFRLVQMCLNLGSLLIALIGLKKNMNLLYNDFNFKTRATFYWSTSLFLTLLSHPNLISIFFNTSEVLKSIGKYSFSFYMLHVGLLSIVFGTFNLKDNSQLEYIIVCLVFTYYVSWLCFRFIENPLIRFANFLCTKMENISFFGTKENIPIIYSEMEDTQESLISQESNN